MTAAKKRIDELRKEIRRHDHLYYVEAAPQLSDRDYDRLYAELKNDGVAMALVYEHGQFTVGATRGDGEVGDDVTHNLKAIREVPLSLPESPARLEVRGEVYMNRESLAQINRDRAEEGLEPYANPRNLTAGSLKLLDPRESAKRRLRIFTYGMGLNEGVSVKTHTESLSYLKKLGFPVNPHTKMFDSIDDVVAYANS